MGEEGRGLEGREHVQVEFGSTSVDQVKHQVPIWIDDVACFFWKIDLVCSVCICFSGLFTGAYR